MPGFQRKGLIFQEKTVVFFSHFIQYVGSQVPDPGTKLLADLALEAQSPNTRPQGSSERKTLKK